MYLGESEKGEDDTRGEHEVIHRGQELWRWCVAVVCGVVWYGGGVVSAVEAVVRVRKNVCLYVYTFSKWLLGLLAKRGMNPSSMLLIASLMHAVKAKPATSAAYGLYGVRWEGEGYVGAWLGAWASG